MTAGATVRLIGWAYAISPRVIRNAAELKRVGAYATVVRVVDGNATVVRFADGLQAPVHPSDLVECDGKAVSP